MYLLGNKDFSKIVVRGSDTTGKKVAMLRICECGSDKIDILYEGKKALGPKKKRTTVTCLECGKKTIIEKKPFNKAYLQYNIDRDAEENIVRKYFVVSVTKDMTGKYCTFTKKTASMFPCKCNPHQEPSLYKNGTKNYEFRCPSCGFISKNGESPNSAAVNWNEQVIDDYSKKQGKSIK